MWTSSGSTLAERRCDPPAPSTRRGDQRIGLASRAIRPYQIEEEPAVAQEAAQVAPHVYKVLFENERVRLLDHG